MSCYQINGGTPLRGRLAVQGAKNSVLPILAAALLAPGESVIHNCPDLSDVTATLDILRLLGCGVSREGDTVALDARELDGTVIPASLMGELRSSVIFLGALLTRMGEVELSYPGGCELGPRPIDLHLGALRQLGAEIREEGGSLLCRRGKEMRGRELCLSLPSVGATENILLAACGCPGRTTLVGAAQEPEIVDLQEFLRAMGAQVEGAGTHLHRGRTAPPPRGTYRNRRPNCRCDLSVRSRSRGGRDRDHGSGPGPPDSGALRTPGGGLPGGDRGGGDPSDLLQPLEGYPPSAHRPPPGLPHRCPGHPHGRPGRRDWEHYVCGEHLLQPLPPRR